MEELQPERDSVRTPLVQVVFVLQNTPQELLTLPGLSITPTLTDTGTAKFDLTLCLWDLPDGFRGDIEYNSPLGPTPR